MGSTFSGSRLEGLPHSSQYQTTWSKWLFWYWNEVPCLVKLNIHKMINFPQAKSNHDFWTKNFTNIFPISYEILIFATTMSFGQVRFSRECSEKTSSLKWEGGILPMKRSSIDAPNNDSIICKHCPTSKSVNGPYCKYETSFTIASLFLSWMSFIWLKSLKIY